MKYRLKQDLPFMKAGEVFFTGGGWVSGGYGVDQGNSSTGAHNGIKVFSLAENELLENIISNKVWIEKVPTNGYEVLEMHKEGELEGKEAIKLIKELS